MKLLKTVTLTATACLALMTGSVAMADAETDIKYRQGVFKSIGGHMTGLNLILRAGAHPEDFQLHAESMAALAGLVPKIFPAGSGDGKTGAKAEIWEDPEGFQEKVEAFTAAAENIGKVAGSSDMDEKVQAFRRLGGSCKGCHDDYRKKD